MSIITKFLDYLRSAKNELSKVTWPSKQSTIRYSALVIAISLSVAAFFGIMDMGLSKLVTASLANKTNTPTEQPAPAEIPTTEVQTDVPSIDFDSVTPITTPGENPTSESENNQ